ncbi:MAG: SusD/RagB family nutrient-binding outer membrane lipoprotein [Verrucomicrobia bacterium]|nr:SusD/RagB family nutrient-binding outer membrane lipoprotein [Cytophagales bacterium]
MKYIKIFILAGLLLVGISCTDDFDAINTNPNAPVKISAQYLLPTGIEASVDKYWGGRTRFERMNLDGAALWVQYLARNIYANEGDSYGLTPAFYNNNWKVLYADALVNFQKIIEISGEKGTAPNTNYEGVALVMRSWVFSVLTDCWGAIPYSEAVRGSDPEKSIATPAYDSQDVVYAGILADLKTANEKLNVSGVPITNDILFGGNILRWKKFANSLRLRLANRQAAKKSVESKAIMAEILGDPATYPVFTGNADNVQLNHTAVQSSNNEWFLVMVTDSRTDWNVSKTMIDKLKELNDPRINAYAVKQGADFEGLPNALPDAIATSYLSTAAKLGTAFMQNTSPSIIMTYSELQFILAEAASDGDITGNAQTYFEEGIKASMSQYNVTLPATYLTTVGTVSKAKIMEQKWLALFGQGIEAWAEYRRTGMPTLQKDSRALYENDGQVPARFLYPTTEQALNKVQYDKGVTMMGGDTPKNKMWWAE